VAVVTKPLSRKPQLFPRKSIAVAAAGKSERGKGECFFADGIQDELLSNLAKIKD